MKLFDIANPNPTKVNKSLPVENTSLLMLSWKQSDDPQHDVGKSNACTKFIFCWLAVSLMYRGQDRSFKIVMFVKLMEIWNF